LIFRGALLLKLVKAHIERLQGSPLIRALECGWIMRPAGTEGMRQSQASATENGCDDLGECRPEANAI
jgi:hypothetical protein